TLRPARLGGARDACGPCEGTRDRRSVHRAGSAGERADRRARRPGYRDRPRAVAGGAAGAEGDVRATSPGSARPPAERDRDPACRGGGVGCRGADDGWGAVLAAVPGPFAPDTLSLARGRTRWAGLIRWRVGRNRSRAPVIRTPHARSRLARGRPASGGCARSRLER